MMAAHRTKPTNCRLPRCARRADVAGTARGFCIAHYNRWRRYGWCEATTDLPMTEGDLRCYRLAISHLGLCDEHTPAGVTA